MRTRFHLVSLLLVLFLLAGVGCKRTPPPVHEVVAVSSARLPLDPNDSAWEEAPEHRAKLLLQDLVEPRLMQPSTSEVRVRALTNGSDISIRLEWVDPSKDDLPGAGRFVDACAVQLPQNAEGEPPDPQMGETGRPVEILFWRADWQASLNGRGEEIRDLYPHASIDHYPFEAPTLEKGSAAQKEMAARYAPAEAVGNRRGGRRQTAVENLVAEGPGTLAPAPLGASQGQGVRTRDGWAVVVSRRMPAGLGLQARTEIAFAVWEGSQQESGARKMRTGWIPLSLREGQ